MDYFKQRLNLTWKIWTYVKNFRYQWVLLFFLKIGQVIPTLLTPLLYKIFIDEVLIQKNLDFIFKLVMYYIGLYLLETILKVGHRSVDNNLFNKVAYKLRGEIWSRYMHMSISKFRSYNLSDLKTRVDRDVDMLKYFIVWQIFDYIANAAVLIGSAVVIWLIDWRIALLCYFLMPVSYLISKGYREKIGALYESGRVINDTINHWLHTSLTNWKEIKANNLEELHSDRLMKQLDEQYKNIGSIKMFLLRRQILLDTNDSIINQLLIYFTGGILYFFSSMSVSTVIVSVQYYNSMVNAVKNILQMDMSLEMLKPSILRIAEIMDFEDSKCVDEHEDISKDDQKAKVVYKLSNFSFQYGDAPDKILNDISLNIYEGDKLVITGESGSGKSTLFRILTGELLPENNMIYYLDLDMSKVDHHILYKNMTIIFQEPYFMNMTIKEFLLLANQASTDDAIMNALIKSRAHDFVEKLPEGINTLIGEKGTRLSGGQKQKLAISRIFLREDDIVLMDEAFSAIDTLDKPLILKEITNYTKEKTVICISHDMHVTEYFQKNIRLDGGRIIESADASV